MNYGLQLRGACGVAALILACSAGGGGSKVGDQNAGGSGNAGGSINPGTGGSGAIDPAGGTGGGMPGDACQEHSVVFERRIPSVFVLVDRSGTMFEPENAPAWTPLRDGVLQVIEGLQHEVRFGFGAFTGEIDQTCPIFDQVPPNLDNFEPIRTVYSGLGKPAKGETPTNLALPLAREALLNDTAATGGKYILFVTDGEPDYCSDGDGVCPVDSVAFHLQRYFAEGIQTLILGLTTTAVPVPPGGLEAWANAGAGQPVELYRHRDGRVITPTVLWDECNFKAPWMADAMSDGGRNRDMRPALATYSSPGGTAPVFKPDSLNVMDLTNKIAQAIQGVKSCSFDLQGRITVILERQQSGAVFIQGNPVPWGEQDGWHMVSETELVLVGAACEQWQRPESTEIDFEFPCDTIIVPPA